MKLYDCIGHIEINQSVAAIIRLDFNNIVDIYIMS